MKNVLAPCLLPQRPASLRAIGLVMHIIRNPSAAVSTSCVSTVCVTEGAYEEGEIPRRRRLKLQRTRRQRSKILEKDGSHCPV
jgi:hypothetical protein